MISLLCGSGNPLPVAVAAQAAQPSNGGVIYEKDEHEIKKLMEEYVPLREFEEEEEQKQGEGPRQPPTEQEPPRMKKQPDYSLTKDADLLAVFPQMKPLLTNMKTSLKSSLSKDLAASRISAVTDRIQRDLIDLYEQCRVFDQRRLLGYHAAKIGLENVLEDLHTACVHVNAADSHGDKVSIDSGDFEHVSSAAPRAASQLLSCIHRVIWMLTACSHKFANKLGRSGIIPKCVDYLRSTQTHDREEVYI